jgi:hypothetical protein
LRPLQEAADEMDLEMSPMEEMMKLMKGVKMATTDHWIFCELLVGESLIK